MKKNLIVLLALVAAIIFSQTAYANSGMEESAFSKWVKVKRGINRESMSKMSGKNEMRKKMNRMGTMKSFRMGNMATSNMGIFDEMDAMEFLDIGIGDMGNMAKPKSGRMNDVSKMKKMGSQVSMDEADEEMKTEMPQKMKKKMRKKMKNNMNKDIMTDQTAQMPSDERMPKSDDNGDMEEPEPEPNGM